MGFSSWRLGLIVYAIQFLLAMMLGMLVANEFIGPIENSLELEKLLKGYDHTVISDLANRHGDFLNILFGGLPLLALIWIVFSVFINSGLQYTIEKKKPTWGVFWAGAARYFLPFLKIGLFFQILMVVFSALIWIPLVANWQEIIQMLPSEREYIFILITVFFLYLLLILFLFGWAIVSKIFYLKRHINPWTCIKVGFQFIRKNFRSLEGMLVLFALIQFMIFVLYWMLESSVGMISPIFIFVFFLIQQLVIFFRIIWRISAYAAINDLIEWRDNWFRELMD